MAQKSKSSKENLKINILKAPFMRGFFGLTPPDIPKYTEVYETLCVPSDGLKMAFWIQYSPCIFLSLQCYY